MTAIRERNPRQIKEGRSHREIAADLTASEEERNAARIRHNLETYLRSYFGGPREGDGAIIYRVLIQKTLPDNSIAARAVMLNGEVKDGRLTQTVHEVQDKEMPYEEVITRISNSKITSDKDLLATARKLPADLPRKVREAFISNSLFEPFRFPPYNPLEKPVNKPINGRKKQK